ERPHGKARVTLSADSVIGRLVAQVRTQTLSIYAQQNQDAIAKLREELPEEDRILLVLRVDRELEWIEIARVFLDAPQDGDVSPEDLKRESARLRKRFQLVKENILTTARKRGLLPPSRQD